jgi:hypothetical protein
MAKAVFRRPRALDGDDGDNEPMEIAGARLGAACGFHKLTEFEPPIATTLAMLPPKRPTVVGVCCVAEA